MALASDHKAYGTHKCSQSMWHSQVISNLVALASDHKACGTRKCSQSTWHWQVITKHMALASDHKSRGTVLEPTQGCPVGGGVIYNYSILRFFENGHIAAI